VMAFAFPAKASAEFAITGQGEFSSEREVGDLHRFFRS
jgi:hypothetical protein